MSGSASVMSAGAVRRKESAAAEKRRPSESVSFA